MKKNLILEKISHRFFSRIFSSKIFFFCEFFFLSMLILEGPPLEFSTLSPNESSQCSLNKAKAIKSPSPNEPCKTSPPPQHLLIQSSIISVFCGGVPAVTHLLFVAAIRLIGVPAPSDGSS